MDKREKANWKRLRQMGRKAYIWKYGVLFWGLPVGLFSELAMRVRIKDSALHYETGDHFLLSLAVRIIFFGLAGVLYGYSVWRGMERKFNQK